MNKTQVRKVKLQEAPSDFALRQSQSYEKRLEALERIRQEYTAWKHGSREGDVRTGLQRVYRIIKRK